MKSISKYATVRNVILEQIQNGELKPGDKLLSEQEYAEQFDVSNITVRKALAELVADGYITRIKSKGTFVKELPLKDNGSKLVSILLSPEDYYDISYMQIIKGAQKVMAENDYSLIVEWGDKNLESEQAVIVRMIERKVDGLLIYPFDPVLSRESYKLIQDAEIPYVQIDRYDINAQGYFVGCNNYEGGILATRTLLDLGHREIFFASYQFFLSSELERYDGYCSAMRQAGITLSPERLLNNIDYDDLKKRILSGEITALFCCNDKLATKVVTQLINRDVRIPEDVSIIGFDNWKGNQDIPVALTTIQQDFMEIGQMAALLLINAMNKTVTNNNMKLLTGVSLVMGDSVQKRE
ncbi:GntR family transcriptional regulator [Lachnospiraceae bacterium OttesenSCG-928-D06]|nr:GntR family transcriptional regulator [Lachnospiraceae bacterium OttesenSCG-928-D06]